MYSVEEKIIIFHKDETKHEQNNEQSLQYISSAKEISRDEELEELAFPSAYLPSAIFVIITVTILIAMWFFAVYRPRSVKHKKSEKIKSYITQYSKKFDVDDVDIERSPTDGYHVTYDNNIIVDCVNQFANFKRFDSESTSSSSDTTIEIDFEDECTGIVDNEIGMTPYSMRRLSLFMNATESIQYMGVSVLDDSTDDFDLLGQDDNSMDSKEYAEYI